MKQAFLLMNKIQIIGTTLLCLSLLTLAGCSKSENEASTEAAQTPATSAQSAAVATQDAPAAATGNTATAHTTSGPAASLPKSGKVIKAMHAGGYTYMQVEDEGKQFWIAATMLNVKRNDRVAWTDAAVMKDFKSSTLRRTFDEILFVSSAAIQK